MTTVPFPNQELAEEQAAEWVAKIDRGLEHSEEHALGQWLEASSLHGEMLLKCASMFDLLDVLKPIAKLMPIDEGSYHGGVEANTVAVNDARWYKSWAIAASIAILFAGGLFVGLSDSIERQDTPIAKQAFDQASASQRYKTAVGEISTVSLDDGSSLQLNTDSELFVTYSEDKRSIELLRGEVYFKVAKDSARPFIVNVGDDSVTAIGTAFSVNTRDISQGSRTLDEVIVTEGRVKVSRDEVDVPLYLTPGQKAVAMDDSFEVSNDSDPDSLLAWREGIVVFQGESLTEVIREIDRYTALKFTIVDQELASISVGGFFKTGDLDQLLLVLENNFGVASQRRDGEVFLSKIKD